VIHHQIGDPSPGQANTIKGLPGRHFVGKGRRQCQPAAQSERVTCGNDEGGGPGRCPMPGPDCGSRITRLHPQESTATASRYCRQFPHRPQSGPDDLAVELNPHKTELNPH